MTEKFAKNKLIYNLELLLKKHKTSIVNPTRNLMIREAVNRKEAVVSACGALSIWTPWHSTGRSPRDTYIVQDSITDKTVDWDSPNNNQMTPHVFDMLWEDALKTLSSRNKLYVTDRTLGADTLFALPVRTITNSAITALFTHNMFRPVPKHIDKSLLNDKPFTLLVLPHDKLDQKKYRGKLRQVRVEDPNSTSWMVISVDMTRRLGIIYGSAYCGSVKKLMFTVMNYLMPEFGVLPVHCSANEGSNNESALLLGLSGTGKTTLSADPNRALLGDDEHGWSKYGIFNFENGCYAKLYNLRQDEEPEIWHAVLHNEKATKHGVIIENAMMFADGTFDLDDDRMTQNSRASYPLEYLINIKKSSTSGHPKTILFLTADAFGVLPPISRLTNEQAMLWFLMGYTSKLSGTEQGVDKPRPTYSRFFGQPFMPRNPDIYVRMFGEKLANHETNVYLINTGWRGDPDSGAKRIDLKYTRQMVQVALNGKFSKIDFKLNRRFHLWVPTSCPGIPENILDPVSPWKSKRKYDETARELAKHFSETFDKKFGNKGIDKNIERECPGK